MGNKKSHNNLLNKVILKIPEIIPGIEKVVCIYFDSSLSKLNAVYFNNDNQQLDDLNLSDNFPQIQKIRSQKNISKWFKISDLPYESKSLTLTDISLFNEVENIVLLLRFFNEYDGLNDLVYIHFKENLNAFGIESNIKNITNESKQMIGLLTQNAINFLLKNQEKAIKNESINVNKDIVDSIFIKADKYKNEFKKLNEKYSKSIISLCKHILIKINNNNNSNYIFSESAIEKLAQFDGELNQLEDIIITAVEFADSYYNLNDESEKEINEWFIKDIIIPKENDTNNQSIYQLKYSKTSDLLDKLELATQKAMKNNYALTSAIIGNLCPKPITAPAITDALKKHKNKILELFDNYPEKWLNIRNNFKPIINIISNKFDNKLGKVV